jgi:hypothetical protein
MKARWAGGSVIIAEFGVRGLYFPHEHYLVFWRRLSDGDIGVVTKLLESSHQIDPSAMILASAVAPQRKTPPVFRNCPV